MQKSKVTIIGAGIPGLTLALILAQSHCAVTIIDKYNLPKSDALNPSARTAALMQGSLNVLALAGAWPQADIPHARLAQLCIIDDSLYPRGKDKMVRQDFKADEIGLSEFGYNIPLNPMVAVLADKARLCKNITIIEGQDVDQDHQSIKQADLIVGADGRNSIVRQWAKIGSRIDEYDQSALTCVIRHSKSHENTSTEFHRTGGPCTFVPYQDHDQSSVVWVDEKNVIEDALKLSKQSLIQLLQKRSRDELGQITDIIIPPESWPLITLKAEAIIAPKIVLIAEAAHVVSPIGAQGLNMSLRDVEQLANHVIEAMKNGQDIGSIAVLKSYERARNSDVVPRMTAVNFLHKAVANNNIIMRGARRLGLKALSGVSPVKTFLMQEGLAPKVNL